MASAAFTNADQTFGIFVRANGQLTAGPLPPAAGDVREEYDAWLAAGNAPDPYVAPAIDLVAYAAEARWRRETGGITFAGSPIATDRESQAMISGAYAYVRENPAASIKWKTESGFITLGAVEIVALAKAVGAHVQACFFKEAEVAVAHAAGTITSKAAVDAAFAAIVTTY